MKFRSVLYVLMLASLLGLSACAGLYTVSSDVASYGAWPADRKPTSFAFERLPSQARNSERQDQLEAAASAALEKTGFSAAPDMQSADVLVMVGARVSVQDVSPWDDPFWWQYHHSFWHNGPWIHPYSYTYLGSQRYDREVVLVLRDRKSGEALYEARASTNGPTVGDLKLLGAMFEAALKDFPRTVSESHSVSVQVPRP